MDFKPFKIGKYLLLERIATGGMAEVYRAKASGAGGFEKQVAIKRILPTYSTNDEFRRMFEYEARLSSQLTHSNIVQIYDFVKSGDTYLLAMEYVHGKNLRQLINKAKKVQAEMPLQFSIYVLNEVCQGLDYAHKKKDENTHTPLNIIHRDMSPQNIMLSYDGAVKIVDFGIAKAKDRVDETRSGVIKGKFGYMSPEQANGLLVDHRTDIFSTGIILYELLTHKRLFAADNDMATLRKIQDCVIQRPSLSNARVPQEMERIVLKGLSKDLSLRYQDAGTFHKDLQKFLSQNYPSFSHKDASDFIQHVFHDDIEADKKRMDHTLRQTIPFSQGAQEVERETSISHIEKLLDGEQTASEEIEDTIITQTDESGEEPPIPIQEEGRGSLRVFEAERTEPQGELDQDEGEVAAERSPTPMELSTPISNSNDESTVDQSDPFENSLPELANFPSRSESRTAPGGSPSTAKRSVLLKSNETNAPPYQRIELQSPIAARRESNYAQYGRSRAGVQKSPSFTRGLLSLIFVSLFVIGTLLWVLMYVKEPAQRWIPKIAGSLLPRQDQGPERSRDISDNEKSKQKDTVRPRGDCSVKIDTDPQGAKVIVGGNEMGETPNVFALECKDINLTLRKEGYANIDENIVPTRETKKIYKTLTKIPTGTLELEVKFNFKIYVNGQLKSEARNGETVRIPLRAGQTHSVQFVNEAFGVNFVRQFSVAENKVTREEISVPTNQRQPSRRNR